MADISFKNFGDFVNRINKALEDFTDTFRYKRKELTHSARAGSRCKLFTYPDSLRNWAINEGGGTEVQYHLYYDDEENCIGYGIGFNTQYVPFANKKSPIEYMQPFVNAYLLLRDSQLVKKLKTSGFKEYFKKEKLLNLEYGKYYFFGRRIQCKANSIMEKDFNQMIIDLKTDLFDLYCQIFTKRNENMKTSKQQIKIISNITELLKTKYNIILHGAPGTGKTFAARQIAAHMMFNKVYENLTDDEKDQIGFVQFHPSYDYTDFVEGLRPRKEMGQNEIGFERKNGVFKDFCEKAMLASNEAENDNFEKSWNEMIDKLNNDVRIEILLVSGKGSFEVELNEYGDGLATRTYNSEEDKKSGNWIRGQSKFFSKEQLYNIYKGLNGIPSGGHDNYRKAIVAEMKKSFHLEDYKKGTPKEEAPKFIFIIDEINRGDMSKIFGELFFSIDPSYRGINGKVLTQYQNLIEDGDIFKSGFYIPDNVYIIGTMNDIDRSVESMDFAMRRRFVFYEVTAEDSAEVMGIDYSDASPMKRLNDTIKEKLGSDYQIGGSYFKEYKDKLNNINSLKELWENNLKGLLGEYLRGQKDAKSKLNEFESVFYGTNTDNG